MQHMRLLMIILFSTSFSWALDSSQWKPLVEDLERIYQPHARSLGKEFKVEVKDDPVAIAGIYFDDITYLVKVTTGYLNQPRLTQESLRIALCHEAGHHFGGNPRRNNPMDWDGPVAPDGLSYSSSEGQADYFATQDCFEKMATDSYRPVSVPQVVHDKCVQYTQNVEMCERKAMASLEFLNITKPFPISFETPDTTEAPRLIRDSYPTRQCRLDTLLNGALGLERPKCWFR